MLKIDDNLLQSIGLGDLPKQEKNRLLQHIYETLEMRVGMKLAEQMTDEQLNEFEGYINQGDEEGALKWLESNFPDYKKVVEAELTTLRDEIAKDAEKIVSAIQAETGGVEQPPQQ